MHEVVTKVCNNGKILHIKSTGLLEQDPLSSWQLEPSFPQQGTAVVEGQGGL